MLIALGNASFARGKEVEFIDHYANRNHRLAMRNMHHLSAIIGDLRLKASVRVDGARVFVKSEVK
jgi:hypothetical protein